MDILAVTIGGLGDAVLFSPVLKALRVKYPKAFIQLLVASELVESVYSGTVEIDRIHRLDTRIPQKVRRLLEMIRFCFQSRRQTGGYDLGVYATGLNPDLSRTLKFLAGIRDTLRASAPPACSTDLECNVNLARRFDPEASASDAFVPISASADAEACRALWHAGIRDGDRLVAVYPSTELRHRYRWSLSNLVAIVERIKKDNCPPKVVAVGSSSEGRQWRAADRKGVIDANLAGELSICASAALLRRCTLTIGNDGGLMHVAGAVDCPVVVVMVNTPPAYKPPGRQTTVVRAGLNSSSDSYPAGRDTVYRESISAETVFQACARILAHDNPPWD